MEQGERRTIARARRVHYIRIVSNPMTTRETNTTLAQLDLKQRSGCGKFETTDRDGYDCIQISEIYCNNYKRR
jgi:hypothetical protein